MSILKIFEGSRTIDDPKNKGEYLYRVEDIIKNVKNFKDDEDAISYWKKFKRDYTRKGGSLSFMFDSKKKMEGRLIEYASVYHVLFIIQSLPEPDLCGIQTILANCGNSIFKEIHKKVTDLDECFSMMLSNSKIDDVTANRLNISANTDDFILTIKEQYKDIKEWEINAVVNSLSSWTDEWNKNEELNSNKKLFDMLVELVKTTAINLIHERSSNTFEDLKNDCKDASNMALSYISDYMMIRG